MKVPATELRLETEMETAAVSITSPDRQDLADTLDPPDRLVPAARKANQDATVCPAAPVSRVLPDTSL